MAPSSVASSSSVHRMHGGHMPAPEGGAGPGTCEHSKGSTCSLVSLEPGRLALTSVAGVQADCLTVGLPLTPGSPPMLFCEPLAPHPQPNIARACTAPRPRPPRRRRPARPQSSPWPARETARVRLRSVCAGGAGASRGHGQTEWVGAAAGTRKPTAQDPRPQSRTALLSPARRITCDKVRKLQKLRPDPHTSFISRMAMRPVLPTRSGLSAVMACGSPTPPMMGR